METDHWAIRNFSFMDMATFGFGFSVFTSRMCCFLDFVSSTICDFLLFSLWLLVSTKIVADFWTWYCAFLQFWAILLASDISNRPPTRNQNLKFTSLEEATSIPLRGISLKGVCRETKTAHFHQIFQLSTPDRAVGIAHVSLQMGPAFQCIKHFFYNLYIKYKITNVQ